MPSSLKVSIRKITRTLITENEIAIEDQIIKSNKIYGTTKKTTTEERKTQKKSETKV